MPRQGHWGPFKPPSTLTLIPLTLSPSPLPLPRLHAHLSPRLLLHLAADMTKPNMDMDMDMDKARRQLGKKMVLIVLAVAIPILAVFLGKALLAQEKEWPRVGVVVVLIILAIIAFLAVWFKEWYHVLKVAVFVNQALPVLIMFSSCEVHTYLMYGATTILQLFLMDSMRLSPRWLTIATGVAHLVVGTVGSILQDMGVLEAVCIPIMRFGESQTFTTVSWCTIYFLMAALYITQEQLLMRHNLALQEALKDARHHMEANDRMMQVVSHEMRSPLHVISGLADALSRSDGEIGSYGRDIEVQCRQLLVCPG